MNNPRDATRGGGECPGFAGTVASRREIAPLSIDQQAAALILQAWLDAHRVRG